MFFQISVRMYFKRLFAAVLLLVVVDADPKINVNQLVLPIKKVEDKCATFDGQDPDFKVGDEWEGTWQLMTYGPVPPMIPDLHCFHLNLTVDGEKMTFAGDGFYRLDDGREIPFPMVYTVTGNMAVSDSSFQPSAEFEKELWEIDGEEAESAYWYMLGGKPDEYHVNYMCKITEDFYYSMVYLYTRSRAPDPATMEKMYQIVEHKLGYKKEDLTDVLCER